MAPLNGPKTTPIRAVVLRLLFMVLGLSLFIVSAARADTWSAGAVVTYNQVEWFGQTNIGGILYSNFDNVYSSTGDEFVIGSTTPGHFIVFTDEVDVADFLLTSGLPGPLDMNYSNPTTTSAGVFGGDVAALKLNIDFSNAGLLPDTSGLLISNLVLTGFSGLESSLNGMTVDQFFGLSQAALGGESTNVGFADVVDVTANINAAFDSGQPDSFAQDHLVAPGSSAAMPEPPTLLLAVVGLVAAAIFRKMRLLGRRVGV
jgi:hypothetical protein